VRARPAGPGWAPVRAECPDVTSADNLSAAFVCWFAGLALVYGALFGTGHLLFGHRTAGAIGVVCAIAGGIVLIRTLPRLWRA
jgi:solute:Na+ symporter, SSS family